MGMNLLHPSNARADILEIAELSRLEICHVPTAPLQQRHSVLCCSVQSRYAALAVAESSFIELAIVRRVMTLTTLVSECPCECGEQVSHSLLLPLTSLLSPELVQKCVSMLDDTVMRNTSDTHLRATPPIIPTAQQP